MFARNFNTNTVVANLIIINVLVLIFYYVADMVPVEACGSEGYFRGVDYYGALYLPTSDWFRPWQLLTHMFIHAGWDQPGGWMHIVFNMYALWMFGSILERVWGPKKFLIYYLVCGLGASLTYIAVRYFQLNGVDEVTMCIAEHQPMVGASGAIFGILLAFGMLFPNTELMLMFPPIPIKAKYFVALYGLMELFFGMRNQPGDNVAHFAHLGGMIFGFILVKIWSSNRNNFY